MSSAIDYFTLVKDKNLIRHLNGAEAVGDDNHRFAFHQFRQGILDMTLAFHIEGRSSLVEYKYGGVFQKGSGQGNSLFLPPG